MNLESGNTVDGDINVAADSRDGRRARAHVHLQYNTCQLCFASPRPLGAVAGRGHHLTLGSYAVNSSRAGKPRSRM